MQKYPQNIFSSISGQAVSTYGVLSHSTCEFIAAMNTRLKQLMVSFSLSQETIEKLSDNFNKAKEFLKENKQIILGVTAVTALYLVNQKRSQKNKNNKTIHIHSLTSNPNNWTKRSVSNKKEQKSCENLLDKKQAFLKGNSKKHSNSKLNYGKAFISEGQQEQEEYIRSDEEDKDNPDLSASTRRTESILSDIQPLKRKKKANLKPILDLVQEQDQTQDRVFFEMYRTYRES